MKLLSMIILTAVAQVSAFAGDQTGGYVAHEWGTFTSLQDAQGSVLAWRPLASSHLPGFVYDWQKPGLGRVAHDPMWIGPKSFLMSYQRLETPVIYFYADRDMTVDTRVDFPRGAITEWYPQATQIGRAFVSTNAGVDTNAASMYSTICWSNVQLVAVGSGAEPAPLPGDASGSHYFAARETDASAVTITAGKGAQTEHEKFLFYRGVGDFKAPLGVSMPEGHMVALTNAGVRTLPRLFVLTVREGRGSFVEADDLQPGERREVGLPADSDAGMLDVVSGQLGAKMTDALVAEGLYPREAAAMVKTWSDSWFAEDGVRVLYALPRHWTDQILPMTLNPSPRELVRVMVGRAEVLTAASEDRLADLVKRANDGDAQAVKDAQKSLATLGRFADAALVRAISHTQVSAATQQKLFALLPPRNPSETNPYQ